MSIKPKNIPQELIERRQWLIWRFIQKPGEPKPAKVPHTCQGYAASHSNPDHWSTFEFALKAFARPGFCDGIGYVFSPDDPYTGIDLDNIYPSDAAECAPWAEGILSNIFRDTYLEASPSDCGIKIWKAAVGRRALVSGRLSAALLRFIARKGSSLSQGDRTALTHDCRPSGGYRAVVR